jgi:hypothetical protein
MTLNPSCGDGNSVDIRVHGENFPPGNDVYIQFNGNSVGSTNADSAGRFDKAISVHSTLQHPGQNPVDAYVATLFRTAPRASQSAPAATAYYTVPCPVPRARVSPNPVEFGQAQIGTTGATRTVTVESTGTAPLVVSSVTLGGSAASEFAIIVTPDRCSGRTLAPGQTCQEQVQFRPTNVGDRTATLSVTDNASDSPQRVTLHGVGSRRPVPAATLVPDPVDLGQAQVGTPGATGTATLTSVGTAPLSVNQVTIGGANGGDFGLASVGGGCAGTLAPGQSCKIQVSFLPTAPGPRVGVLSVADNAADSPQRTALVGQGLDVPITSAPTLVVVPPLGRPGTVTLATGNGFPACAQLILRWSRGITQQIAVAGPAFQVPVLIMRHDQLGPRLLEAVCDGSTIANAPFLVVPGSVKPGGSQRLLVFRG